MRRYNDVVEVSRGLGVSSAGSSVALAEPPGEGPREFWWNGRHWQVHRVIEHWVETGAWWWLRDRQRAVDDDLDEREFWRVEASADPIRGRSSEGVGVFDLAFEWRTAAWRLVGCVD